MAAEENHEPSDLRLAMAVRSACEQAAVEGYEAARIAGLCAEGAFEAAVSAMRMMDLQAVLSRCSRAAGPP